MGPQSHDCPGFLPVRRRLGSAWGDGGREGSFRTLLRTRGRKRRPHHPGAGRSPPEAPGSGRDCADGARLMAFGPVHLWAGVGAARAERPEGMSIARSGTGKPARRSGAGPRTRGESLNHAQASW